MSGHFEHERQQPPNAPGEPSSVPTLRAAFERARREILRDVRAGTVPADVPDFVSLDHYADRNVYGGLCDPDFADEERFASPEESMAFAAGLQDAIDIWITTGGLRKDIAVGQ